MQEINELKNLVVQSLESHGVLSQLRAQIRSSVFKIIDMQETQNNKKPNSFFWENPLCQKIYENEFGSLAVELITEMLQFYKMDYTLSVFPHEANLKEEVSREKLSKKLSINSDNDKVPLLISMIKAFLSNSSFEKRKEKIEDENENEETKEMTKGFNREIKESVPNDQFANKKEIKKEAIQKDSEAATRTKEQPVIQNPKKEQEIPKEIPKESPKEIPPKEKKPEPKEIANVQPNKQQPVPPLNTKANPKNNFDNFQIEQKETKISNNKATTDIQQAKELYSGGAEITKEKKTLIETQQKMGDFEKKIASKQIAEIPALPIKQEITEKPMVYNVQPGLDKKQMDIPEKKNEKSNNYDDEHFDEYNEEVNEEIFHEDENIEEMMYRQQEGQMDPHAQQGLQSSDENFGASQSQGFDILVNSTTLEEYDYFEDVLNP